MIEFYAGKVVIGGKKVDDWTKLGRRQERYSRSVDILNCQKKDILV